MAACGVSKCGPVYPGAAVAGDAGDVGAAAGAAVGGWAADAGCCAAAGGRGVAATCVAGAWVAQPAASAAADAAAVTRARRRNSGPRLLECGAARSLARRPGMWARGFSGCGAEVFMV